MNGEMDIEHALEIAGEYAKDAENDTCQSATSLAMATLSHETARLRAEVEALKERESGAFNAGFNVGIGKIDDNDQRCQHLIRLREAAEAKVAALTKERNNWEVDARNFKACWDAACQDISDLTSKLAQMREVVEASVEYRKYQLELQGQAVGNFFTREKFDRAMERWIASLSRLTDAPEGKPNPYRHIKAAADKMIADGYAPEPKAEEKRVRNWDCEDGYVVCHIVGKHKHEVGGPCQAAPKPNEKKG